MILLTLICSASASAFQAKQQQQGSPIEKVIQMISDLEQKVIAEGQAAQKIYDEFAEWCEEESKNLQFEIKTAKGEAEDLKATIEKAAADIGAADEAVEELAKKI